MRKIANTVKQGLTIIVLMKQVFSAGALERIVLYKALCLNVLLMNVTLTFGIGIPENVANVFSLIFI